jgi:hypothetical protein
MEREQEPQKGFQKTNLFNSTQYGVQNNLNNLFKAPAFKSKGYNQPGI